MRKTLDDDKASCMTDAFGSVFAAMTSETIAALATEQRQATRSGKARARPRTRSESLTCRVRPGTKSFLLRLAHNNGGKTISDGLEILLTQGGFEA